MISVTLEGRLGRDPDLRFIPSGEAVANFPMAYTVRKKQGDQWVDGATLWFKVTVWRRAAENVAESLKQGDLVIVHGDLSEEVYTDREGVEKTSKTINAKWVGPSLAVNTATVNRAQRQQGQGEWQQPGGWNPNAGQRPQRQQQPDDPWATGGPQYDEPPF